MIGIIISSSIITLILWIFYYYIKYQLIIIAKWIAIFLAKNNNVSLIEFIGAIELLLIASCHFLFCLFLVNMTGNSFATLFSALSLMDFLCSVMIGIGCVGFAVLLCTIMIVVINQFSRRKSRSPYEWAIISTSGWIRHHQNTIKLLPIWLAILIITLQIASEETIFRGILINLFDKYNLIFAEIFSILIFILMQAIHMPSLLSAMFPMIGAAVLGTVHTYLYTKTHNMLPLIISHLSFFLFTLR